VPKPYIAPKKKEEVQKHTSFFKITFSFLGVKKLKKPTYKLACQFGFLK
jgi:hypothetical protein